MEEKVFNIVVVYTDGRSKGTTNARRKSKEDAIIKEVEDARFWKEDILSITVVEVIK